MRTDCLKEFVQDYLEMVANNYGGDVTVNQLRVLHFISTHVRAGNEYATHSAICKGLGLPAATITRAVGAFVDKGVLWEETDPREARRRRIRFCEGQPGRHVRDQVVELARRHDHAPDFLSHL